MAMTRQAARGNWISRLQLGLSVLILAASGVANGQYFYRIDVPPSSPGNCNSDSVDLATGTVSWNLPPPPNNVVYLGVINGVHAPDYPDIQTITPTSGSETAPFHIAPLGSPGTPYTGVVQAFPAINGNPVGTGAQITVQCNTLGEGKAVATFSVVQAPSAAASTPVPATSPQALLLLTLLLAGAAAWRFRQGRRAE